MHQWLESAKVLASKLEKHSEILDDPELRVDILLFSDLIRQAESEMVRGVSKPTHSIVGQSGNISRFIQLDEIAYCQSDDKKVFITDANYKVYRTAKCLKEIEREFPSLIRINQSTIIHVNQINSMEFNEKCGHYAIKLVDGRGSFKISRRCYKNVKELFRKQHADSYLKAS
jgi:DNA-binding LytR/AlgR family response regulator